MLTVGFLSSQNYYSRSTFSGTLYSMHQALRRQPVKVVDLGWPLPPGLWERVLRRWGTIKHLEPGKPDFHERSRVFHQNVKAQLKRQPCDVLMAPVASPELCDMQLDLPVVYASDTTFRLYVENYDLKLTPPEAKLRADLELEAIRRASSLLYPSRWAANSAVQDYGARPEQIHLAAYGANLENPPPAHATQRRALQGPCKLLFVARDFVRKGGNIALGTLATLKSMGIPSSLTVVGTDLPPDANRDDVEVIVYLDKNNPADARRLSDLYLDSHFLVFPTKADCSPISLCEAAAHGLPVVSSNVGGISDIVSDDVTGALIPAGAPAEDFGRRIAELWSNPERYKAMVRAAREAFEQRLNWDAWGEKARVCLEQAAQA